MVARPAEDALSAPTLPRDAPRELDAALNGPAPCDDCRHAARCGAERLACDTFAYYARGVSEQKWRGLARQPTAERFTRIFGDAA